MSKTVFQIGLVTFISVLNNVYGLLLLPILTKNLPLEGYGIWIQFVAFMGIISILAFLGLDAALLRYIPISNKDEIREILFSVTFIVLFIVIVIISIIILISNFLLALFSKYSIILLLIIAIPVYSLSLLYQNYFLALNKIKIYSIFIFFFTYGDLFFIFFLIKYGIEGVIFSVFLNKTLILLITLILILKDTGFHYPNFSKLKKLLKFSLPLLVVSISSWVLSSLDKILIGLLLNLQAVAIYAPGYALSSMVLIFSSSIVRVIHPRLVVMYENKEYGLLDNLLSNSIKGIIFFLAPSFIGLSLLSYSVLKYLSTEEIAVGNRFTIPFIMIGVIFYSLSNLFGQIFYLQEKTYLVRNIFILGAILNTIINLILIPVVGIIGAAISTAISYLCIMVYIYLKTHEFYSIDKLFILKCIVSSIIMSFLIYFYNPYTILQMLIYVLISIFIYFISNILLFNIKIKWIRNLNIF